MIEASWWEWLYVSAIGLIAATVFTINHMLKD